ncbi:acireductone dioxygenase [Pseudomonas sp. zbq_18]|uniref:acireductone dioxygenase n=1 Tax=Pseudomonas sp. zbq_18 TaxID=3367251 RepID=UPI00370A2885
MSSLTVYHQSSPDVPSKLLTHDEDIAATLAEVGVGFERWPVEVSLKPGQSQDEVLGALRPSLDELMVERGYAGVEVLSQSCSRAYQDEPQVEMLEELCTAEAQGHLLAAGRGLFNLHIGEHVFAVLCEKDVLLSLPSATRYWFDQGAFPHVIVLEMRTGPAASCTGDPIASAFPRLEA